MDVHCLGSISLPDQWDVDNLDEACWKAGMKVARELFQLAIKTKDEEIVAGGNGSYKKKGKVTRYLVTRSGVIIFRREKVDEAGKCSCPLDKAVNLKPYQEATRWVKERACELTSRYGYRKGTDLLGAEIGDILSHTAIYGWVQKNKLAMTKVPV